MNDAIVSRDHGSPPVVALGVIFSTVMVALGHAAIAPQVAVLFAFGFFGGLLLWLARPMTAGFGDIRGPYLATILGYLVHRTDEELSDFVSAVEAATGHQAVAVDSPTSIGLAVLSLLWFLAPLSIRRGHPLGYYAAWTVFASMGLVEVGHFVFPLLTPAPYGYFPGMITAPLVIAAGLWGMWRLWQPSRVRDTGTFGQRTYDTPARPRGERE